MTVQRPDVRVLVNMIQRGEENLEGGRLGMRVAPETAHEVWRSMTDWLLSYRDEHLRIEITLRWEYEEPLPDENPAEAVFDVAWRRE